MKVFVSHVTEEAPIALVLKRFIEDKFLGMIEVFVSSDAQDLPAGDIWFQVIETALHEAKMMFVICSPASLVRPWINFEAGCGWIKGMNIVPFCHSGQHRAELPYPFGQRQALDLHSQTIAEEIAQTLARFFKIGKPDVNCAELRAQLDIAIAQASVLDRAPQIIRSARERTELINKDLRQLLDSPEVAQSTVWSSAFLSTLAIGPDDPYPEAYKVYLDLLLEEKDLLLRLAREGCNIKCIISPANRNHIRHAGLDYAVKRTQRLIEFLQSNDSALSHMDWAISELGTKNLYIIGHLSCFEGYKQGIHQGYGLSVRQTAHDAIKANIEVYSGFFKDLAARTLTEFGVPNNNQFTERELLRSATLRCLERSLQFLNRLPNPAPVENVTSDFPGRYPTNN